MGRVRKGQPINGLLLVDKATGLSSNAVVQTAKRLFQAQKVGHTGSLDPLATGLLPVCFGEATKFAGFLLDTDKRYNVRVRLGFVTETADAEGEKVNPRAVPVLSEALIEAVLTRFRGDIEQVPPMYSALKRDGQPLYRLARRGVEVERAARPVTIHSLALLEFGADWLDLDVHCSKGTYIRSLAVDIGEGLGCGGFVETLRRTAVGCFDLSAALTLDELDALAPQRRESCLLPTDRLVDGFPALALGEAECGRFRHGQPISLKGPQAGGMHRVYSAVGEFVGIATVTTDARLVPNRLIGESTRDASSAAEPQRGFAL